MGLPQASGDDGAALQVPLPKRHPAGFVLDGGARRARAGADPSARAASG